MSTEGAELSNRFMTRDVETMSDETQNNRMDILECLSVLINENNSGNDQTEELTLDEHLLSGGTTLTAVTLPDGTQAFVTNNFNDDDMNLKKANNNSNWKVEIPYCFEDITEFAEGKPLQLELEPATLVQARDSTIENVENYPHVEVYRWQCLYGSWPS